jgi:hypothetical protein
MLRTTEEFMKEIQYTEVLSKEPLIKVEKIGVSDPVPFKQDRLNLFTGRDRLNLFTGRTDRTKIC